MDDNLEEIKQRFVGKWKVDRDERFENFLAELGVNFFVRKIASTVKPTSEIMVDSENITITLQAGFMKFRDTFILNEEFDSTVFGVKRKVTPTYSEGQLAWDMIPYDSKDKAIKQPREIVDGDLVLTLTVGQVSCKRYFKRLH